MQFYQTKAHEGNSVKAENYHYTRGLVKIFCSILKNIFM